MCSGRVDGPNASGQDTAVRFLSIPMVRNVPGTLVWRQIVGMATEQRRGTLEIGRFAGYQKEDVLRVPA